MKTLIRTMWISALLLVPIAFAMKEAGAPDSEAQQGHLSGLTARITLRDGTVSTATLEGLGCSVAICSRVAIKGKTNGDSLVSFWLDGIAAIKNPAENEAVVVMKNGTEQHLSLVTDFRVLYLSNRSRTPARLDLSRIKLLEFLPPAK